MSRARKPIEGDEAIVSVRMPGHLAERIDAIIAGSMGGGWNRSRLIRDLVAEALDARSTRRPRADHPGAGGARAAR